MKEIKFTSSPWGFRETPLKEQCEWLKAHDIEYICGQFFDNMKGMFSPNISDEEIEQAKKLVSSYGLSYASFNGDGDFMVEKDVDKEVAICCERIDKAAKFEPKVIIVFAGWQSRNDDKVYEQVASALKRVSRHAAKYNFVVALENHGGLTRTSEQINRILDKVGEDNIGINYDPANFLMYGEDPLISLKNLKYPIVFTHFKSLKTVDGKKEYCRIGEGMIDYIPILEELSKRYEGFYAIEYEEPSDVFEGSQDDLNTLKELLSKV